MTTNMGAPTVLGERRQYLDARNSVLLARKHAGRFQGCVRAARTTAKAFFDSSRGVEVMGRRKSARAYAQGAFAGIRCRL